MTFDVLHVQIGKTYEYLLRTARSAYSVYILRQVSGICYILPYFYALSSARFDCWYYEEGAENYSTF